MDRGATEESLGEQDSPSSNVWLERIPYWMRWTAIPVLITVVVVAIGWEGGREFPDEFDYGREIGLRIDEIVDWMKVNLNFHIQFHQECTFDSAGLA